MSPSHYEKDENEKNIKCAKPTVASVAFFFFLLNEIFRKKNEINVEILGWSST